MRILPSLLVTLAIVAPGVSTLAPLQEAVAQPAPWSPPPPPPGIEKAAPRHPPWFVRVTGFVLSLFQTPKGAAPFRDPFTMDDPSHPWRTTPPRPSRD